MVKLASDQGRPGSHPAGSPIWPASRNAALQDLDQRLACDRLAQERSDAEGHRQMLAAALFEDALAALFGDGEGACAAPRGSTALRAVLHCARRLAPLRPAGDPLHPAALAG